MQLYHNDRTLCSDKDLCEIISFFNCEEFLELVVDDVGATTNLLAAFVLTTLYGTQTDNLSYSSSGLVGGLVAPRRSTVSYTHLTLPTKRIV